MIPHQKGKRRNKNKKRANSLQIHAQLSNIMEVREQLETLNLINLNPKFDI